MTSQLNVALICKLCGSLMCLAFLTGVFYNQALADVRSTGAWIKCLFCSSSNLNLTPVYGCCLQYDHLLECLIRVA